MWDHVKAPEVCDMLMDSEVLVKLLLIEGNLIPVVPTNNVSHPFHSIEGARRI